MMRVKLISPFISGGTSLWKHTLILGPNMHNFQYRIPESEKQRSLKIEVNPTENVNTNLTLDV